MICPTPHMPWANDRESHEVEEVEGDPIPLPHTGVLLFRNLFPSPA